jgi:DNA primase
MENRVILPYTYGDTVVGYQARWIGTPPDRKTPKMISHRPAGYVFNLDSQNRKRKYTVVVEGEYDALSIGGVAVMTNSINPEQAKVIEDLDTEPVVVADRDSAGRGLLEQAAALGWSASFPDWPEDIKDANDAVQQFGRIATLQSILSAIESNPLKIKLLARRWCV